MPDHNKKTYPKKKWYQVSLKTAKSLILPIILLFFASIIGLFCFLVYAFGKGGALVASGVLVTSLGIWLVCIYFTQRKWPTTNGWVTHSEVDLSLGIFGERRRKRDRMNLKFSYTVEGQTFDGSDSEYCSQHCFQNADLSYDLPEEGKIVTVYYNPRNHAESFLERGVLGCLTSFSWIFVGIVLIGVGWYLIWGKWV